MLLKSVENVPELDDENEDVKEEYEDPETALEIVREVLVLSFKASDGV